MPAASSLGARNNLQGGHHASPKMPRELSQLAPFVSLAWLFLGLLPAVADVYPVNGVWAAPHPEFPISADEACFTVKVVGVQAVARKSIAQIVIFTGEKRYTVKANAQSSHTLQSAKATDGGYWITELPTERQRFWFRRKVIYFLAIVDPVTLEIRDNSRRTRFVKCGQRANCGPKIAMGAKSCFNAYADGLNAPSGNGTPLFVSGRL
jgi:hypothetical protein